MSAVAAVCVCVAVLFIPSRLAPVSLLLGAHFWDGLLQRLMLNTASLSVFFNAIVIF